MEIKNIDEIDNITPKAKWVFDGETAKCFSDMLERSIPDYWGMRNLVYEIGEQFIKKGTWITDVGCSTGIAAEAFYNKHNKENNYFLCDSSEAMTAICEEKFSEGIKNGFVKIVTDDFFNVQIPDNQSLILSVLAIQFMPTVYRQEIINNIYNALSYGGVFLFVEKIIASNRMNDIMTNLYYDMKHKNGYSEKKIIQKQKSLENVLSPLKSEWNENMLKEAGFKKADVFWRRLNFCGWAAVK